MSKLTVLEKRKRAVKKVEVPPMPKSVQAPTAPEFYRVDCQKCGKSFETAVKSMQIIMCRGCWGHQKAEKQLSVVKYRLNGLSSKKNLPR